MSKTLVLFDFDGTLTRRDTFPQFIFYAVGKLKGMTGFLLFSPMVFLYVLKVIDGAILKEKLVSFYFKAKKEADLRQKGENFMDAFIPSELNDKVIKELESHKSKGSDICIVSASLNIWIEPFCRKYGTAALCTELEFNSGICTGKFKTPNCNKEEKAIRIKQKYDLAQYSRIIAYGNSSGDNAMFGLAHEKHRIR